MIKLKRDCGNCKHLCTYPVVCCDIGVPTQTYYLDKENTAFGCRPKFAYECKAKRLEIQNKA